MKIVYTYCSFGKDISQFTMKMAELSVLSVRSSTGLHTVLYTDVPYMFSHLPYDEIVETDFCMEGIDSRYWNFPKLWTYAQQNEPFLHIDIDTCFLDGFSIPDAGIVTELVRHPGKYSNIDIFSINGLSSGNLICSGLIGGSGYGETFRELYDFAREKCSIEANNGVDVTYEHLISIEEHILTQIAYKNGIEPVCLKRGTFMHFWCERNENKEEKFGTLVDSLLGIYRLKIK